MKTFTASCVLLAVTSHLTYAQSNCDPSVGIPITDDVSSSSVDYTISSAGDCDATCQMFLMDQQSSLNDNLNDAIAAGGDSFLAAAGGKRDLEHPVLRRQGLSMTCSVTEACFVYDSIPFCIDVNTGDFAVSALCPVEAGKGICSRLYQHILTTACRILQAAQAIS